MIGILLINLGTPTAPTEVAVREYLNLFLSDPYVITLPTFLRNFLVQKIILKKRPVMAAKAYEQIWTKDGSPLLVNSIALKNALSEKLKNSHHVVLGMRYGNPSLENAVESLQEKQCKKVLLLPLFPQFSDPTTQSALNNALYYFEKQNYFPDIKIISDFHDQDFYIHSLSTLINERLKKNNPEFILFSYHGLPKRKNNEIYRTQCYSTTQLITQSLQLPSHQFQVCFQSRLGFIPWISPYTDKVLPLLSKKGIKKIAIVSPSFVADCLETLKEINIRLRNQWMALGGDSFDFMPCLNANEYWVNAFGDWILRFWV